MNTEAIIKQYKGDYTRLDDDAMIRTFYIKGHESTHAYKDFEQQLVENVGSNFSAASSSIMITTIADFLAEEKERRFIKLYSDFLAKWNQRNSDFPDFSEKFIQDKVKVVINEFLSFNPNYITFDLTEDSSVFFQASVDDKNIYLELFFAHDVKESVEAILNVYVNKECVLAYGSTIKNTFAKLTGMVKSENLVSQWTIDYELSGTTLATPIL